MKTRSGFVSNSSSSSFVVLGIKVDENPNGTGGDLYERAKKMGLDCDYAEGEGYLIGKQLARWSEGEGGLGEDSFESLQKYASEIQPKLTELMGKELPIKLFYGEIYG